MHRRVSLMCARQDVEDIEPLARHFNEYGLAIQLPAFSGGASDKRAFNQQVLLHCDGVVIYWGVGTDAQFYLRLQEAIQARHDSTRDGPLSIAVYIGPPKVPQKESFKAPDVIIIHSEESVDHGFADLVRIFTSFPKNDPVDTNIPPVENIPIQYKIKLEKDHVTVMVAYTLSVPTVRPLSLTFKFLWPAHL
jgi:hypothetical protein